MNKAHIKQSRPRSRLVQAMPAIQTFKSWKESPKGAYFAPSPPRIPCYRNPRDCRCGRAEGGPKPPPAITYPHHFMPVNSAMQQWVLCTWVSVCLSLDVCASERVQAAGSFNKANSAVDCRAGWLTVSVVAGSMAKRSASPPPPSLKPDRSKLWPASGG